MNTTFRFFPVNHLDLSGEQAVVETYSRKKEFDAAFVQLNDQIIAQKPG